MNSENRDGFEFVAITMPHNVKDAICIIDSDVDKYVRYINEKKIQKVYITNGVKSLNFLKKCKCVKYLTILGGMDYTPLYEMDEIKFLSLNNVNEENPSKEEIYSIDLARLNGLKVLGIGYNRGIINLDKLEKLETLVISHFNENDLMKLSELTNLESLRIISSRVKSLNGIQLLTKLRTLYIDYVRNLCDISQISHLNKTLNVLKIDSCNKIKDFSSLKSLSSLILLSLFNCQPIENLNLLTDLKDLKTFVFNINVLDGNLSLCTKLNYVFSAIDRKHYSHKDSQLPKGPYIRGNESIDEYKRIE